MTFNAVACKVAQDDSSNMEALKCAVVLITSRKCFADSSPAPGPGVLSAILLQFLPLFIRCDAARQ